MSETGAFWFCSGTAATWIYAFCLTLSLHDALPIWEGRLIGRDGLPVGEDLDGVPGGERIIWQGRPSKFWSPRLALTNRYKLTRLEEHTSELQSLMRISYAVFSLTKKTKISIARQLPTSIRTNTIHIAHTHTR